jgi:hypothetical protein
MGAVYCRDEFPSASLPSGAEKVFRIAQLLLQYLLYSQERLTEAVEAGQETNREISKVL